MEGRVLHVPPQQGETLFIRLRRDLGLILLLLIVAGGLRAWSLNHTEVVARDSIIFIDYALQFESKPWTQVLRENHQHPGYPLSVWALSLPVRQFFGATDSVTMQLSAQFATALAGILLVVPMFYLGKTLFDRGVGFWGALLFQCLPVSGRILADGLSEGLFLLLATTALLLAVRGLRSGSAVRFVLCGLCCGLAYLTRPEGAVIVAALLLLLLLMQVFPAWRRGWKWTLSRGASVALVALAVASPYLIVTHRFTTKPSGERIVKPVQAEVPDPAGPANFSAKPGIIRGHSSAMVLAVWLNNELTFSDRLWIGVKAVVSELTKGFNYFIWLPALLGLWWYRRQLTGRPEAWLMLILFAVHSLVLWRLAVVASYVSERHVLLLVLCGMFPAAAGLRDLPRRLLQWRSQSSGDMSGQPAWRSRLLARAPLLSVVLLLATAGAGLPRTLQALHANRAGHHAAGLWLARHARAVDEVQDGHFGWAFYYAGRWFMDPRVADVPGGERYRYVVKGTSTAVRNSYAPTAEEANMTEAEIRAAGGEVAFRWSVRQSAEKVQVTVWKIKLPLKTGDNKTVPVSHAMGQQ
jgi:hypothetical protein